MADLGLGKMVGPLPVGGWIAVVGGGLGLALLINRNLDGAGDEPEGEFRPSVEPVDPATGGRIVTGDFGQPTGGGGVPQPTTNEEWVRLGVTRLSSMGFDPLVVQQALRKYTTGRRLTNKERAIVTKALEAIGPPPEAVPVQPDPLPAPPKSSPPKSAPTPAPKQPAPRPPRPKPKPRRCSRPPRPSTLQPGEEITDSVVTSDRCGALYLTSVGGVHTAGKLPSGHPVHLRGKGSIPGTGPPHTTPGNRPFVRIEWFGPEDRTGQRGYRIWNRKGQTWEFI